MELVWYDLFMHNTTLNPGIIKLVTDMPEAEAVSTLSQYNKKWRILSRDGAQESHVASDRDDSRYNLVLVGGRVVRVLPG